MPKDNGPAGLCNLLLCLSTWMRMLTHSSLHFWIDYYILHICSKGTYKDLSCKWARSILGQWQCLSSWMRLLTHSDLNFLVNRWNSLHIGGMCTNNNRYYIEPDSPKDGVSAWLKESNAGIVRPLNSNVHCSKKHNCFFFYNLLCKVFNHRARLKDSVYDVFYIIVIYIYIYIYVYIYIYWIWC